MNLQFPIPALVRKCLLTLACFSLLTGNGESLHAQGASELTAMYGRGVHAFFGCDSTRAEQLFSEVIMSGSNDPRVYYFRGLARMQQGREYEAEEDFRMGAALEARDPGQRYAIGKALQRIQGAQRQTLEQFRREGRLDQYQDRRSQNQLRYEQLRSRESDVLHQDAPVPLEDLADPSLDRPAIPGPESTDTEPTQKTEPTPEPSVPVAPGPDPTTVPAPSAPVQTPEEDPFGIVPPQQPTADEEDPFGAPAPSQPESTPAAEPESDDPFGATEEPGTPADDVFGDPVPVPEESAPTTEPEPADDPFGFEPAAEPATEPAPDEPSEEDPFGSPEASSPPAESSPVPEDTEAAPSEPDPVATTDDPFGSTEQVRESLEENQPGDSFFGPDGEMEEPVDDEPTPDETTLDEEVAHEEDAEAAADMEAAEEANDVGAFGEDPVFSDDPFGQPVEEDTTSEQSSEEAPPADDSESSEDSSTEGATEEGATEEGAAEEGAAEEGAAEEGETSDESTPESSTDVEDPFGGF